MSEHLMSGPTAIAPAGQDHQQPAFRLLDLPDELWVRIGKFVIEESTPCRMDTLPMLCLAKQPAILQVCSRLRSELRLQYYNTKIEIRFRSVCHLVNNRRVYGEYLRAIGPHARRQIKAELWGGSLRRARAPIKC